MTAPLAVSVRDKRTTFQPGTGLPTITYEPLVITDQPTLDSVISAAALSGVALVLGAPDDNPDAGTSGPWDAKIDMAARIALRRAYMTGDRRNRLPRSEVQITVGATVGDPSQTKAIYFDVTAKANNSTSVMSPSEIASVPWDIGQPGFQHIAFKSGANASGFLWSSPSQDPNVIPGSPHQNAFVLAEHNMLTDAPYLSVLLDRILGSSVMGCAVLVNDEPCQSRPFIGAATADFVNLKFGSAGKIKKVTFRTTAGFGPVYIPPGYHVWKPEPELDRPSIYLPQDSYGAVVYLDDGSGSAGQGLAEETMTYGLGDGLGVFHVYPDPVAGTNVVSRTNGVQGPSNNYQDRWPQVIRIAQSRGIDLLVILNGSADDSFNNVAVADQVTGWRTILAQLRAVSPNTQIAWIDAQQPSAFRAAFDTNARYLAMRNALLADATILGIGVYYGDFLTHPPLTGLGKLTAPAGDGTSNDLWDGGDGAHLTGLGYQDVQGPIKPFLGRVLLDDPTSPDSIINTVVTL